MPLKQSFPNTDQDASNIAKTVQPSGHGTSPSAAICLVCQQTVSFDSKGGGDSRSFDRSFNSHVDDSLNNSLVPPSLLLAAGSQTDSLTQNSHKRKMDSGKSQNLGQKKAKSQKSIKIYFV